MAAQLTKKEIYDRMVEWRNIKKLHKVAREKITQQHKLIRKQNERIVLLEKQNALQQEHVTTLELQIEELRVMVFGKKKNKADKNNDDYGGTAKKRKEAMRTVSSYRRRIPSADEVTHEKEHCANQCPDCGTTLKKKRWIIFYEEDIELPVTEEKPPKTVIKHHVERGWCERCRRWEGALSPPKHTVVLGSKVRAFICYAGVTLRLSFSQIQTVLSDMYQFPISDGEIRNILCKEAQHMRPEYEAIKKRIRKQEGAHFDESAWRVLFRGLGNYAWTMVGTETNDVAFLLGRSRGSGSLQELRGDSNSKQVGISDDYCVYSNAFKHHQLCWAHPHRKLRDLATTDIFDKQIQDHCKTIFKEWSALYKSVERALEKPFDIKKRKRTRALLLKRFDEITTPHSLDPQKLRKIKKRLKETRTKYFTCLLFKYIPADNNKAERSLRHLVIKRKISFGSKTRQGAEATSVLASVLLTLKWKKPDNFFLEYFKLREKYVA